MVLYAEDKSYKLYNGDMLDMLDVIEPNSVDSIVTDPPYELGFMDKGWDNSGIAFRKDTWEKCIRALKPGGICLHSAVQEHITELLVRLRMLVLKLEIQSCGFTVRDFQNPCVSVKL